MVFIADLQKHLSGGVFLQELTPAQVFSYEFCEIFWNIYFEEHLLTLRLDYLGHVHFSFLSI